MDTQTKKPTINKKTIAIIIVLILILAFVIIWQKKPIAPGTYNTNTDNKNTESGLGASDDTTASINQDLVGISINSLDEEFTSIDADLNKL